MCFFIFVPLGYSFPGCGQTLRNRKSARKERRKYGALSMICRVRRQTFRPAKIFPTALITLRALLAKADRPGGGAQRVGGESRAFNYLAWNYARGEQGEEAEARAA